MPSVNLAIGTQGSLAKCSRWTPRPHPNRTLPMLCAIEHRGGQARRDLAVNLPSPPEQPCDAVVIGGGFGGLGAALTLAESGLRVTLLERVGYLGGCAGTFERQGQRWEAGATLSAGLAQDQLFGQWISRHRLEVAVEPLDPVVTLRTPTLELAVSPDRTALVDRLIALVPHKGKQIKHFFAIQRDVAQALWPVLDDPTLLPPWTGASLLRHLQRSPRYMAVLPWLGRPLMAVLQHCDAADVVPLRQLCDSTCQITVQCPAAEAEAPLALAALDYWFAGAGHVTGGLGRLASELGRAIVQCGGEVRLLEGATKLESTPRGWRVHTRHGTWLAPRVMANLLPDALAPLLVGADSALPHLQRLAEPLSDGWTAAMLYLTLRPPPGAGRGAHHLDLTCDPADLTCGRHVFLSVSAAADAKAGSGLRTALLSTHVPIRWWRGLPPVEQPAAHEAILAEMRHTLAHLAPEWASGVVGEFSASARTWQRFTGRPDGKVGGAPRRAGLHNYSQLHPVEAAPGLWLVGDSVFPGQSALATATGGQRAAVAAMRGAGACNSCPPGP